MSANLFPSHIYYLSQLLRTPRGLPSTCYWWCTSSLTFWPQILSVIYMWRRQRQFLISYSFVFLHSGKHVITDKQTGTHSSVAIHYGMCCSQKMQLKEGQGIHQNCGH